MPSIPPPSLQFLPINGGVDPPQKRAVEMNSYPQSGYNLRSLYPKPEKKASHDDMNEEDSNGYQIVSDKAPEVAKEGHRKRTKEQHKSSKTSTKNIVIDTAGALPRKPKRKRPRKFPFPVPEPTDIAADNQPEGVANHYQSTLVPGMLVDAQGLLFYPYGPTAPFASGSVLPVRVTTDEKIERLLRMQESGVLSATAITELEYYRGVKHGGG